MEKLLNYLKKFNISKENILQLIKAATLGYIKADWKVVEKMSAYLKDIGVNYEITNKLTPILITDRNIFDIGYHLGKDLYRIGEIYILGELGSCQEYNKMLKKYQEIKKTHPNKDMIIGCILACNEMGCYAEMIKDEFKGDKWTINIPPKAAISPLIYAHELGHLIDWKRCSSKRLLEENEFSDPAVRSGIGELIANTIVLEFGGEFVPPNS